MNNRTINFTLNNKLGKCSNHTSEVNVIGFVYDYRVL